jgi:REP element-mobilizing transposase RayT
LYFAADTRTLAVMSRPLRIEFPGAVYHVTSRGDRREPIYVDDEDREAHLAVIARAMDRFDARVLAYCLMGNHYHLLVQTRQANLSQLMRQVNGVYTQVFNRRHGQGGHLFQGRFKAILVDGDAYLATLCRYVERNPVAVCLVAAARDWPWSSCQAHLGEVAAPSWLDVDSVAGHLLGREPRHSADRRKARQKYAELVGGDMAVEEGGPAFSWADELRRQIFLGNDEFVARVQSQMSSGQAVATDIPKSQRRAALSLQECLERAPDRNSAIAMACREGGMTMTAIAKALGLSVSRVSRVISGLEAISKT